MTHFEDLDNIVFNRHKKNKADEMIFLGGFIGPEPVYKLSQVIDKDISCKIIYGCFKKANIEATHLKYVSISNSSNVSVFYKDQYNHSKIYMWIKNNHPVDVLIGSANFSSQGLYTPRQETLVKARETDFDDLKTFLETALRESTICTEYCPAAGGQQGEDLNIKVDLDKIISRNPPHAKIFLGDEEEHIHEKSGLNWGFGRAHVEKDCSYIPIRRALVRELPELFPMQGVNSRLGIGQGHRNQTKDVVEAIFDDNETMSISFEGHGSGYIKQLTSFPQKNILGRYIRRRLGLDKNDFITYSQLVEYGRTDIDLINYDNGIYKLDFSVQRNEEFAI